MHQWFILKKIGVIFGQTWEGQPGQGRFCKRLLCGLFLGTFPYLETLELLELHLK